MSRRVLIYGSLLAICLVLYKVIEHRFIIRSLSAEYTFTLVAILFTLLGIWAGIRFGGKAKGMRYRTNRKTREDLQISKREYEVLELLAEGLSNQEIADRLFVSLNTIKTHSTNLYSKLEAKRRTQAIEKARSLGILEMVPKGESAEAG